MQLSGELISVFVSSYKIPLIIIFPLSSVSSYIKAEGKFFAEVGNRK